MDTEYIQSARDKLQKRLKRLNASNREALQFALGQTWIFLQKNELFKGVLDDLERRVPEAKAWAEEVINDGRPTYPDSELGNSAVCYWIFKTCAMRAFSHEQSERDTNEQLTGMDGFRESYVEPLFDYIEEQINERRMALALLRKYKHRCEWFRRADLLSKSKQGETTLIYDLYEYLHDQGLQFHIEPKSAAGRVDLISAQTGENRLVADAKIFNPDERSHDSGNIVDGFRQVYEYLKDFNEQFGYLVIFKTCEADLSIPTEDQQYSFSFICHNNKTIFFVIVDVFDYPKTASGRGKLKSYEILPSRFIESLSESAR